MYDKCYFCLDQLPKLKKESTASFFVNFGRSRGTKEPTYITVFVHRTFVKDDLVARNVAKGVINNKSDHDLTGANGCWW